MDADALLLALRYFRADPVAILEREAGRILHTEVTAYGNAFLRKMCGGGLQEEAAEEAIVFTKVICSQGKFCGNTRGEAVRFVQQCVWNRYRTVVAPASAGGSADDEETPRRRIAKGQHTAGGVVAADLVKRLVILRDKLVPKLSPRAKLYLDVRLGLHPAPYPMPETFRASLSRGKCDVKLYIDDQYKQNTLALDEVDFEALERLLGTASVNKDELDHNLLDKLAREART